MVEEFPSVCKIGPYIIAKYLQNKWRKVPLTYCQNIAAFRTDGLICDIKNGPKFVLNGNEVKTLHSPNEFFSSLQELIKDAKQRIVLTSLYLGCGSKEIQLVNTIKTKLADQHGKLDAQFLFDFTRGSRGTSNSRTVLLPLLKQFPDRVRVALFHSPMLRGLKKIIVPERYNEVFSVQHMKIYLVDNSVIISGANLSDQYFTNRQDRYIVIHDKQFADFCHSLVEVISLLSYHLNANNQLTLSDCLNTHPFKGLDGGRRFREEAFSQISKLLSRFTRIEKKTDEVSDTTVTPLLQMSPFYMKMEQSFLLSLFSTLQEDTNLHLASGYFNLTDIYHEALVSRCRASVDILTASAEANGFFGAHGVSGAIPSAYICLANQFMQDVEDKGQRSRIRLLEYTREGWTFHAKGLWCSPVNACQPNLTVIGSSNFGYRSMFRDIELQVVIHTSNQRLMHQLELERDLLYKRASVVTSRLLRDRVANMPTWITISTPVIRNFF